MARPIPDFTTERMLIDGGATLVAGMDEVGRGAIAGPVMVGVVVVDQRIILTNEIPEGLADSKLLSEKRRVALVQPVNEWCIASAVGVADASEIDEYGIMLALQLAGQRALAALAVVPDVVIVDGPVNWLSGTSVRQSLAIELSAVMKDVQVVPKVKADQVCASVSAASIVSKVQRDQLMVALHEEFPAYGWASNKGYGSAKHREAIASLGPCHLHRRTWNLTESG
jgi:ribonuclease HII